MGWRTLLGLLAGTAALGIGAAAWWLYTPGPAHAGPLPALTPEQAALAGRLRADVTMLAGTIGERHVQRPAQLLAAERWIADELAAAGWEPRRETFDTHGTAVANVIAERRGTSRPDEIVLVGAHYDSVTGAPGADDNGSGVAVLLALARGLAAFESGRTLRLVAFVNEENYFQTELMGSRVHARGCKARGEKIVAMYSLETLGYYADAPGSQIYPMPWLAWIFPDRGDFVGFVADPASRALLNESLGAFRAAERFPAIGAALPASIPGVAWSDQEGFWREGYPGVMVTDTAPFRNPHYHRPTDTPDTLDYERMARVTTGLAGMLRSVLGPGSRPS